MEPARSRSHFVCAHSSVSFKRGMYFLVIDPTHRNQGCLSPCGRYFANSLQKCVKVIELGTSVDLKVLYHNNHYSQPTPVIWVHGGGYLLCARQGCADLWYVETQQRCSLMLSEGMYSSQLIPSHILLNMKSEWRQTPVTQLAVGTLLAL